MDLVIRRDRYLTIDSPNSSQTQTRTTFPLKSNEYLLLGDNYPVSEDSRHWAFDVQRSHLLGRVIRLNPR
jgi:hypothetical protein